MPYRTIRLRAPILALSGQRRAISSTLVRRAEHDVQHTPAIEDPSVNTHESFFSPAWRNTLIILTLGILTYPYLPSPPSSQTSSSPTLSPDQLTSDRNDSTKPMMTRWLARMMPDANVWKERNDRHLALSREAAEGKLLIQDAEMPKIRRLGVPRSVTSGSPHGVPVGPAVDMSNVGGK